MLSWLKKWAVADHEPRYEAGFVIAAFAASFLLRYALADHLPNGFPYLTFFPAVIITAFFAGTRAGAVLGGLCGIAAWYFFIAPFNSFALTGHTALALAFYFFIIATDIVLIHVMGRSLRSLETERARADFLAVSRGLMFHELQHRVSNNLQVVSSLLKLQRRDIADPAAQQALDVASARLQVVSRIQRLLHDPERQQIDFARFLREIVPDIVEASGATDRAVFAVEAENVEVSSDQSIPLALISTEFISNAIEHGMSDDAQVTVRVRLVKTGPDRALLEVIDNGPGAPEGFAPEQATSLGLKIAGQFAAQLDGTLSFETRGGMVARIEFPLVDNHIGAIVENGRPGVSLGMPFPPQSA